VLQGIEFWSSLASEEKNLENQGAESKSYVEAAMFQVIPILLEIISHEEDMNEKDEWNPHKAATVCLTLISNLCKNSVIHHVYPFIKVRKKF